MEGSSALPIAVPTARPTSAPASGDRLAFLAFVDDTRSEQVLREVLLEAGPEGAEVRRGGIGVAIQHLGRATTPQILLVDVAGVEQAFEALDELAQVCEPDVKVLVVGDREDLGFYRDLTRGLGVAEYLFKPLTREIVSRVFLPHLTDRPTGEVSLRGGRVVLVAGVRGGVGATTIAANLAVHLADDAHRHVALVDLNLQTGSAALMLGARPSPGLRTAIETPEKVDLLFLERAGQPVGDRLRIFAAEERLGEAVDPTEDAVDHLIQLLRSRFNYVVIDAPAGYPASVRAAFERAHQRVLVMAPDLANARDLLRFHALPNAPMQARRGVVVLNQLGRPGALTRRQVEEALELTPDVVVPYLPRIVPASAHLGEPAVRKTGAFRSAIAALAQEIAALRPVDQRRPRFRLRRLFRR